MNPIGSVLLDTTIVVDHLRDKNPATTQKFKEAGTLYLPLTVLGELFYGVYNSAFKGKGLIQMEEFLKICAVLIPDERTARFYGRIKANLKRIGKPIPQNDIWIAALAVEHDLPLITRDQHFSSVAGLSVLRW